MHTANPISGIDRFIRRIDAMFRSMGRIWDKLKVQLSERLLPLIEQLKPIWQDPLWQAIGLIIGIILAFFLLRYLFRVGGSIFVVIFQFFVNFFGGMFRFIMQPFKKKGKAAQAGSAKAQVKKKRRPRWKALSMLQMRRTVNAVKYLTTKRDWRYSTAWMLLIGEHGSGKSRMIDSVHSGRRAQLLPQEKSLRIPGSGWSFFDHALVIDQDNESGNDKIEQLTEAQRNERFDFLMQQLHWYRPERPLDSIILTVSAKTLWQSKEPAALHALGEDLMQQLWRCQKTSGFVLPVYLVVTQCDYVEGFSAFWQAQGADKLKQMIGWSNPYRLDSAFSSSWVNEAFKQVVKDLQGAQLEVAASGEAIEDIDRFMLFKQYFCRLQEPLTTVLGAAFARSSYQEALPLRGIYFTGEVEEKVSFVDDLMSKKIFAEKHLAYPLERRRFSTQKTLRRFQFASVVGAAVLVMLLFLDSYRLESYTDYAKEELEHMLVLKQDCTPEGLDTYRMLDGLGKISEQPWIFSMPLAWLGSQRNNVEQMVANQLMSKVMFKSMECRLKLKAETLKAYTQHHDTETDYRKVLIELRSYSSALEEFQLNREYFLSLSGPLANTDGIGKKFRTLLKYLYDRPIPEGVDPESEITLGAIQVLHYDVNWDQDGNSLIGRDVLMAHLDDLSKRLQQTILNHARQLPLGTLRDLSANTIKDPKDQPLPPSRLLHDINDFQRWLLETEQDWLGATALTSPCGKVYQLLSDVGGTLVSVGYSEKRLNEITNRFSEPECDHKVRLFLSKLHVSPFGSMFTRNDDNKLEVSESLRQVSQQVGDLETLDFVIGGYPAIIDSSEPVVAWRELPLQEVLHMLLNYQQFLVDHSQEQEAFFAAALNRRLEKVVERLLSAAMVRPSQLPPSPYMVEDPMSFYEAELSQSVASFKNAGGLLLQIDSLLQQLGDDSNHIRLTHATNNFVLEQLEELDRLTVFNRLYTPVDNPRWDDRDFTRNLFDLNTDKQIDTYLSSQRERLSFLANKYAGPLISFLHNSNQGVGSPSAMKWWNTLADLGRFERGDVPNQVQQLNEYIGNVLVSVHDIDCYAKLKTIAAPTDNSWFSVRREQLMRQVNMRCQDAGVTAVQDRYLAIRERFNSEISGRFPFADVSQAGYTEMAVEPLKAYLDQYSQDAKGLLAEIDEINQSKPGTIPQTWRRFIERMNNAEQVLNALWSAENLTWKSGVNVKFAAKNSLANGANQIIEWVLRSGEQKLLFPNGGNKFDWQLGDTLTLGLRWASGSSFEPLEQPDQWEGAPLIVNSDLLTAEFRTLGDWGLFEWLARYGGYDVNSLTSISRGERMLSFHVPVILKDASLKPKVQTYVSRSNLVVWVNVTDETGLVKKLELPGALPSFAPGFND